MGNPQPRQELRALVRTHRGNLSELARALGVSRQAATRRLEAAGLVEYAAEQRVAAGVTGPRSATAVAAGAETERAAMLKAFGATDNDEAARARLGMARRSFYRKKAALGIDAAAIAAAREARQARPRRGRAAS